MFHIFGWWHFDEETCSLVNRISGESLNFIGATDSQGQSGIFRDKSWLRFEYVFEDLKFPVLVEQYSRRYTYNMSAQPLKRWQIDYVRSAAAWFLESNENLEILPYGVWRRVDDCVSDALLCWPHAKATGKPPFQLKSKGGWLNGTWSDHFSRSFGRPRFSASEKAMRPEVRPRLFPLHTMPPIPWRYVHSESLTDGIRLPAFPTAQDVADLEDGMPHLRRNDGLAVLYPSKVVHNWIRGEDLDIYGVVHLRDEDFSVDLYVDNRIERINKDCYDVRMHALGGNYKRPSEPRSGWSFQGSWLNSFTPKYDNGEIGCVGEETVRHRPYRSYTGQRPGIALSQQLNATLIDAMLTWKGMPRFLDSNSVDQRPRERPGTDSNEELGLALHESSGVSILGRYVGGIWCNECYITAGASDSNVRRYGSLQYVAERYDQWNLATIRSRHADKMTGNTGNPVPPWKFGPYELPRWKELQFRIEFLFVGLNLWVHDTFDFTRS